MIIKHLTDEEIQQYAMDPSQCPPSIAGHAGTCMECEAKVASYRMLISGIRQEEAPAFDFDLSAAVLAQLPAQHRSVSPDNFFIYLFMLIGFTAAGIVIYIFHSDISNFLTGITALTIYLAITTVVILLAALCVDMYRGYQKKMNSLDFY